MLNSDQADVWDSGKVLSKQSTSVQFGGTDLQSGTTYYWKIRVWGENDNPSSWSPTSTFTTVLPAEEWSSKWIQADLSDQEIPALLGVEWSDYTFEAEVTVDNAAAGLVFRASDRDNLYFWQLALDSYDAVNSDEHVLRPHVMIDGSTNLLDEIPIGDTLAGIGESNRVQIDLSGSEITTSINGEVVDTRTDGTHDSGTIGFRQYGQEEAKFDSISVSDSSGDVLFSSDFDSGQQHPFSRGTVQNGYLHIDGADPIVVPYTDPPDFPREDPSPLLRSEFNAPKEIERARVHVCGPGFYELYLNGEQTGQRVLDPARTNYKETVLFSTFDVTEHIQEGLNSVGVALGHGRPGEHDERTPVSWESDDPVLRTQFEIEFADGSTSAFGTNAQTWVGSTGPTRWDSLRPGQEFFDARNKRQGWSDAGYDDSGWESVSTTSGPPGELTPQRVQPIIVHDTVEPVDMWEPEPDVFVFDLGQMIAGWPELTVDGESGTKVTLREGEKLADNGTVEEINYYSADCLWQEYILEGEGEEVWEPRFTYGGFRYVQVEGYPGEPSLDSIRGRVVHTGVDQGETGMFQSSNELLNRLHENTRWAMLNNLHGQHTDSPTWEKLGWTETNIEMAESLSANFSMTRFWEKFLRDCRDSQLDNGDIPDAVPHEGLLFGGAGDENDPGWDAATVITAWHAYQYTGDRRILADHYQSMKEYISFVRSNAEDGTIVRTGRGDWASPAGALPPEGPEITSTSCYYQSVDILVKTAELLGHSDDAAEFEALRRDIRSAFNVEFFDAENELYRTGNTEEYRQTSNLYPLALDLVPEDHREAVAQNLARNIRSLDDHLNTGAHGLMHLLPVLSEHGYHDLAFEVATQTTYPSQGYWLKEDITALLEFWPLDARSRTHDFLGSIDEWFFQYIAGLRNPVKPGFEEIEIAPHPVPDLEWAEASVKTIRGPLSVQWERTTTPDSSQSRDGLAIEVTIPGNATGTVRIPTLGSGTVRVRENGETIWNNGDQASSKPSGIGGIERNGNRIAVEVGSGEYTFELE
jgi:alpha-L-rhamnosidase